jgi:hypothetical protein
MTLLAKARNGGAGAHRSGALPSFGNEPEMGLLVALNGAFSFGVTVLGSVHSSGRSLRRAAPSQAVASVGARVLPGSKPRVPPLYEHRAPASVA